MSWITLPNWFWTIYYSFLLITLGVAMYNVIRKRMRGWSLLAMTLTIVIPFVGLINSIERSAGMNEYEHLVSQLQQGAFWSIFTIVGYLFLVLWWILFLAKRRGEIR